MARKPNYKFERSERERAKAAKINARLEAKQQKSADRQATRQETDELDDAARKTEE